MQPRDVGLLLALLTPPNRLVCQVSLATGLRVGDVVALRPADLRPNVWVTESKTGRRRRIALGANLRAVLAAQSGEVWVFPGARDKTRHRTRQAVWKDLKRAARALRMTDVNVSPHSMRKCYAVDLMERNGMAAVQRSLGHADRETTLLYALADKLGAGT